MVNFMKLLPFIVFAAVGLLVFILCIVSLVIPWYEIKSESDYCSATTTQYWDQEVVVATPGDLDNCTGLDFGSRADWKSTCEIDFCKNKASIFVITRGLMAYATVGTFVAVAFYLVGAFGPGFTFQLHATGAAIFCTGICSVLPLALAIFLFGIGVTAGVHQDHVDYVTNTRAGNGTGDILTVENTPCQIKVACTSLAGDDTVVDPCLLHPFGCYAQPLGLSNVSVKYTWGTGPGYIVAIIATILALATVPTMAIWGLRRKKINLLSDGDDSGEEALKGGDDD